MLWNDAEQIAERLIARYPEADPRAVHFTDLRNRVAALPGFADDPMSSDATLLEAIRTAWYEAVQERQ